VLFQTIKGVIVEATNVNITSTIDLALHNIKLIALIR